MAPATVRTRFAPSPTGRLHLGNLRTALFNALFARRHGGQVLLRIEDTDAGRSDDAHVNELMADLSWLGLHWDEGPERSGTSGPYRQSERTEIYAKSFAALEAGDHAYPCFCSVEELAASRRVQQAAGRAPRYPGTCARLSDAERAAKLDAGVAATLRFRVPPARQIDFDDLVRGPQEYATDDLGDFVIRRSDGSPAFFFANAVDDSLMGVTHVLRGEDHLSNTPRQLLLHDALDLDVPRYGHLSLVVDATGAPLSKRRGTESCDDLRKRGFLPEAILNHLARLGRSDVGPELKDLDGLARDFEPSRLSRSPARQDEVALLHWQKEAVLRLGVAAAWEWMDAWQHPSGDNIRTHLPLGNGPLFSELVHDNVVLPDEALEWAKRVGDASLVIDPEALSAIEDAGEPFFRAAIECLSGGRFDSFAARVGKRTGASGKRLYQPLRAALTGTLHGPEFVRICEYIGSDGVRARLEAAVESCKNAKPTRV